MGEAAYHELHFDAECLTARRRTGGLIRFTRHERALLQRFLRAPRRVLTRAHLLAALDADADVSERNIDFLVNRLRAKLGDDARQPRYIRTQYGEGYVWVAEPADAQAGDAFIAIGPAGQHAADSAPGVFLHCLRDTLAADVAQGLKVALMDTSPMHAAAADTAFIVDVGLHHHAGTLRGVLALRTGRAQRMLEVVRLAAPDADARDAAQDIATRLKDTLWKALAEQAPGDAQGPSDEPAYVRTVAAERQLSPGPVAAMREGHAQLAHRRNMLGDDASVLLEQANLKLLQSVLALGADGTMEAPAREALDAQIESLVMAALPGLQDDPMRMLTAAKLLLGLGPAHRQLAQGIVDEHFEEGAAFATAMVLRAQLRMYGGDIEGSIGLYDHCLAHAPDAGEFRIYLLFLKAIGLLALARRAEVAALASELHAMRPETRMQLSPMHYATDTHGARHGLAEALAELDAARMRERVAHAWHVTARHFDLAEHRVESMRCIVDNAVRLHGGTGVPEDIWRHLPQLRRQ